MTPPLPCYPPSSPLPRRWELKLPARSGSSEICRAEIDIIVWMAPWRDRTVPRSTERLLLLRGGRRDRETQICIMERKNCVCRGVIFCLERQELLSLSYFGISAAYEYHTSNSERPHSQHRIALWADIRPFIFPVASYYRLTLSYGHC